MKHLAIFALGFASALAIIALVQPNPALVGYGCEGANGLIYAQEESDFPMCERIEVRS